MEVQLLAEMKQLSIIENNLVPVYETSTGERVVYGIDLHTALGIRSRYRDWIRNRLVDCEAVEFEDYEDAKILAPSGQKRIDHIIRLDTAKEMAMLERNEKGKQVRRYFIGVEKKYKAKCSNAIPTGREMMALAVLEAQKTIEQQNIDIERMKPKEICIERIF